VASVTVRGEARRDVEPDRCAVTLGLRARGVSADDAFGQLAERSAALDRVLDAAGDAVLQRRPSSVSVHEDHDHRAGQPRGHVATRTVAVELRVDGAPGDLLRRAVEDAAAGVQRTAWLVDDGNAAWTEVRAEAARDARARAEVYARAVGMQLGPLDWVAEPGLGRRNGRTAGDPGSGALGGVRTLAAAPGLGEGERLVLDLRPEPVAVTAAVEAAYTLVPGPPERSGTYL
jgi:uncharacterized protein YggE